jgi:uncharacterized protein (DUF1800 family)
MVRLTFLATTLAAICCVSSLAQAGTYTVGSLAELNALMMRLRAVQFLQHATFGPKDNEIDALSNRMGQIGAFAAIEEWIDQQLAMPPTLHEATIFAMASSEGVSLINSAVNPVRFRYHSWWHNAITAPDQLQQRVAWSLAQIFVVGEIDNFFDIANDKTGQPSWMGMTHYYDMLLKNSTTNYRTLLGEVTFHPVMGVYLSSLRNNKPTTTTFPDENYAREVMQLFSIGLYELNPDGSHVKDGQNQSIPTYDADTIRSFARLFTGMTYAQSTSLGSGSVNFHQPMMMFETNHDRNAKTLLRGVTLPANVNGIPDINAGLDNIFSHPNVGPFICRQLIQRLVRSNPSKGYLGRVVAKFNNNGSGVRGDMKTVIKAILLDQEAWDGISMVRKTSPFRLEVTGRGTERSRLQEPVILYSTFLRRYAVSNHASGRFLFPALDGNWGQGPYKSPTVFNFYRPDYQPSGDLTNTPASPNNPTEDLVAPEFQLLNAVTGNTTTNRIRADMYSTQPLNYGLYFNSATNSNVNFQVSFAFPTETSIAGNSQALADYLDQRVCAGTMSDAARSALVTALNAEATSFVVGDRAKAAVHCIFSTPAFAIAE